MKFPHEVAVLIVFTSLARKVGKNAENRMCSNFHELLSIILFRSTFLENKQLLHEQF